MSTLLIIFVLALLLQALFSGYETGFVSSNPIRVRYRWEEEHVERAGRLLRHLERPDQMLTTLLIGINLTVVVCTLTVSAMVNRLFAGATANLVQNVISAAIVAPVLLVFADMIPKSVFRAHPTRLTLAFLPLIDVFYVLLAPLAWPVAWITRGLLRLFSGEDRNMTALVTTLEDLRVLVDEGVDQGTIEREDQEMIHSVIDLQTTTAKEIMVPRIAIEALPDTATREELVALFAKTGRTRIPIYHETVDTIIGIVNAYSILTDVEPEREDIGRFLTEAMHVPDSMRVGDLFRELKAAKQHLAIVTDEYGGTDGLITIEDILEEIFGEIQDEYDREESRIHKVGPNAYTVDARMSLEEVSEAIGVPIKEEQIETIGGWMMLIAGRIPAQGEVVEHDRFRMTVLMGGPNHIARVRLEVLPDLLKAGEKGTLSKL